MVGMDIGGTSMMGLIPALTPLAAPLLDHAILLSGLYIGAHASAKRLLAIQAIMNAEAPAQPTTDSTSSSSSSSTQTPILSRAGLRSLLPPVIFTLAYAGIFAAYQITNKTTWVDIIPTILLFFFFAIAFDATLGVVFSRSTFVFLSPSALAKGKRDLVFFARRNQIGAWPAVSAPLAMACMYALSYGYIGFLPLMGFTWVVMALEGWYTTSKTVKLRVVVRNMMLYVLAVWLFLGAMACLAVWESNKPKGYTITSHPNGSTTTAQLPDDYVPSDPLAWVRFPSAWILTLIKYHISASSVLGPSIILGLSLRYDLSRSDVPIRPIASDGMCKVPENLGALSRPTLMVGLITLAAVLAGLDYAAQALCVPRSWLYLCRALGTFITIPAVVLASVLTAWVRGELAQWWAYEEVWGFPDDAAVLSTATSEKPSLSEKA